MAEQGYGEALLKQADRIDKTSNFTLSSVELQATFAQYPTCCTVVHFVWPISSAKGSRKGRSPRMIMQVLLRDPDLWVGDRNHSTAIS